MRNSSASSPVSEIPLRALAELELRKRRRARVNLYEFVPRISPTYAPPVHLDPLVQALERSWDEPIKRTCHAPPRHGKTDTLLAFIALSLLRHPERTLGFISYEADVAKSKSRKARLWAEASGVTLAEDSRKLNEWRTREGGGLLAGGVGGPLTGHGLNCIIIDDPYKNRVQAESAAYRAMVTDWWNDVAETRIEPGGSAFICHTRWHHDDLIGHVHGGEDSATWEHINLMALGPGKVALWPERWDAVALEAKRKAVGEYTWASLYQGHPRPRGGAVFEGDVVSYQRLPDSGLTFSIGLDLAYSERTSSDYSVAVVMARAGNDYFVVDVVRAQLPAPSFAARVRALLLKYPTAQVRWYAAGTEMAAAQFFRKEGIPISALNPKGDKFTRAMPLAAAWNRGSVLLPSYSVPWAEDLVSEVKSFTGVRDLHDDQVDAMAAAYDLLEAPRAPARRGSVSTSDFDSTSIG